MMIEQRIWVVTHDKDECEVAWGGLDSPKAYRVKSDAKKEYDRLTAERARVGWYVIEEITLH